MELTPLVAVEHGYFLDGDDEATTAALGVSRQHYRRLLWKPLRIPLHRSSPRRLVGHLRRPLC